jgi:hypothetical protein
MASGEKIMGNLRDELIELQTVRKLTPIEMIILLVSEMSSNLPREAYTEYQTLIGQLNYLVDEPGIKTIGKTRKHTNILVCH